VRQVCLAHWPRARVGRSAHVDNTSHLDPGDIHPPHFRLKPIAPLVGYSNHPELCTCKYVVLI
jgi:hypothetical protein